MSTPDPQNPPPNPPPNPLRPEQPQIYIVSPPLFDPATFGDTLAGLLDQRDIACFRLGMAGQDETAISRAADHLREICHARDVAIVIEQHYRLVENLGLDGCHLGDGARLVREVRKALGQDAIVGAYCANSRHAGLNAGEAGADYIAFGPLAKTALGDGGIADEALFQWWSEMIELPVVAEGALSAPLVEKIAPFADFLAIGAEIWDHAQPQTALAALLASLD